MKENLALQFLEDSTDLIILRIICWEICYDIELLLVVMLVILLYFVKSTQEIFFHSHSHSQVISFFTWWLLWLIDLLHAHGSKGNRMQLFGNDYILSNTNQETKKSYVSAPIGKSNHKKFQIQFYISILFLLIISSILKTKLLISYLNFMKILLICFSFLSICRR